MIQWDLKIIRQKDLRKEYMEYLIYHILEFNRYLQKGKKKGVSAVVPPAKIRLRTGPFPLESTADMFNYLRKTHNYPGPVINCRRISGLIDPKDSLRNRLIIILLTAKTLSIKRITALRVNDLQPEKRKLILPVREGCLRSRHIYLSVKLTELFRQLTVGKKHGDYLFSTARGEPLKPSTIQAIYTRTLKKAGLSFD